MNQRIIRAENGLGFLACLYFFVQLDVSLWLFFLFLLVPDIFMAGYLMNQKAGAIIYNAGHSFIAPLLLAACYLAAPADILLPVALIWMAHIFMDRTFGFGLKYSSSFKETHLQRI